MKAIEERIQKEGKIIGNGIIKVDCFLNHQIDVSLVKQFAQEIKRELKDKKIDKVLTIETSGIAIAFAVAEALGDIPLLFAKKSKSALVDDNVYYSQVKSFTRNFVSDVFVSKEYLKPNENILIVDDFLAEGNAALGLVNLCVQASSKVIGFVTVVEKRFQGGRDKIERLGIPVYAGASIESFENGKPVFHN